MKCEACARKVDAYFYAGSEVKWCGECVFDSPHGGNSQGVHTRLPMYLDPQSWSSQERETFYQQQRARYGP